MCAYNILWKDNGSWVALCHYLIPPIHHSQSTNCQMNIVLQAHFRVSLEYEIWRMNFVAIFIFRDEHIFRKGILNRNIQHDYYDFSGYVAMPMFRSWICIAVYTCTLCSNALHHIIFSRTFYNNTNKSRNWRKKKKNQQKITWCKCRVVSRWCVHILWQMATHFHFSPLDLVLLILSFPPFIR